MPTIQMASQSTFKELCQRNGERLSRPPPGEEVVISGFSGSFPESDNMYELRDNLLTKTDMVVEGRTRWKDDFLGIPKRSGKLKTLNRFDNAFFGILSIEAECMDPMGRLFLEKAFEAIIDGGVNPNELRGRKVGVYISASINETEHEWCYNRIELNGYAVSGIERVGFANKISHWLGITGPSIAIDTACSSSMVALNLAYEDIRDGVVEAAIIGGANIILSPYITKAFLNLGVIGMEGKCKAFDDDAKGYARSEAVCIGFVQKTKDARRVYTTVIHSKINCDGYKPQGLTFPSTVAQDQLLEDLYQECHVDPASVGYVEAHGTGTEVGDSEELLAIEKVFCPGRMTSLPIGSVKSNLGHSEGAAGLCAIAKAILCMELDTLFPNLHYKTPHRRVDALRNGKFQVVTENMPFKESLIGVSSFGFGGANVHVLLRHNPKVKVNGGKPTDNIPRLVAVSGRTPEAVKSLLNDVMFRPVDAEYINLMQKAHALNIKGHSYRGYTILTPWKSNMVLSFWNEHHSPLWLVFSGLGSQWLGMGNALLPIPSFAKAIHKCDSVLKPLGIDIYKIITEEDCRVLNDSIACIVGPVAIQIGLVEILSALKVVPDGIIGHSVGEFVCGYSAGCLSLEQAILAAYYSALAFSAKPSTSKRVMATVEMVNNVQVQNLEVVGTISNNISIIAGSMKDIQKLIETHKAGINILQTGGIVYHCKEASNVKKVLLFNLQKVITNPKPRFNRWISSSLDQGVALASAEFFSNVLTSPALFTEASKHLPENSITVEISPKNIMPDVNIVMYNEVQDSVLTLFTALGKLYENGVELDLSKLYTSIQYPVSRGTPMISPLIKWQHSHQFYVLDKWDKKRTCNGFDNKSINIEEVENQFYRGHVVDGRNLFPATGYLVLVWNTFSNLKGILGKFCSVRFQNVKFNRATYIPNKGILTLAITIHPASGDFEVVEGGAAVVTGNISMLKESSRYKMEKKRPPPHPDDKDLIDYSARDVYKELRLRGYNYSGLFRSLIRVNQDITYGEVFWHDNWVAFLDNLLQIKILSHDSRALYVPTAIDELLIDAQEHESQMEKVGDKPIYPIYINKKMNLTVSGGAQIRGIKANSIARRKPLGEPVLESHQFVPYQVRDSSRYTLRQVVTVCVHVLLENYGGLKLNVTELPDKNSALLAPMLSVIIGDLPLMQAEVKLLGDPEDEHFSTLDSVLKVEAGKLSGDQSVHIVVMSNVLNDTESLQTALDSLAEGGCIIARESPDIIVPEDILGLDILVDQLVDNECIILLKKVQPTNVTRNSTVIKITNTQYDWLPRLQAAIKHNESQKRVLLVAQGEPLSGILGLSNCLRKEPGGDCVMCVFILDKTAPTFDPTHPLYRTQLNKDLAVNVLKDGQWGSYRHLLLDQLASVDTYHAYNNTAIYGDLSSLTWFQGPIHLPTFQCPEGYELVHVHYSALNFKDIMLATGRLSKEVVMGMRSEKDCVIGFEFVGITNDGRRVMGIATSGAISNVVLADKLLLWNVPDHMTLEDAATIPVVYGTVLYALLGVGRIKKGESILIHSGSGGVGQAAIHVALHYGLTVFTTVGTEEKRQFIRNEYPKISDQHIGNSRDTSFEQMIMLQTEGRGVDVVLNSLAEEKLQASIRCLARGGRFLEIGKFDLAANNEISMEHFLKDISFHSIMLDLLPFASSTGKMEVYNYIREGLEAGSVLPLKGRKVFSKNQVEEAYRYMAAGKHMGKVMIKLRDDEPQRCAIPSLNTMKARPRFYCDPNLCYIIAGGLGGFGLELVDWLVLRRARNLVLVSRRGISSGYQSSRIRTWRSYGTKVLISTQDISTYDGVKQLLKEASQIAHVGGIFNLAVVLHDAILENQTIEKFIESAKGKAVATQHFDLLTREMCPELQQFVVFSSVSCGRGNAGQTNYGMSNSIMERICESRVRDGLPGLAIQWGAIGEVGLVADMQEDNQELVIGGTLQQTIASCLEVLDGFLKQSHPVVASMVVAEKQRSDSSMNLFERIMGILGIRDSNKLSPNATLSELGMDSMTGVEVKQTLERDFEVFLTPVEIRDLTILRLKELSETRDQDSEEQPNTVSDPATLKNFLAFDLYSKELLKSEQELYPPLLQLPSLEVSKDPVFMIPGSEGLASSLAPLSARLNSQTYALQLYRHIPVPVIADMVQFLLPFVKAKLDDGVPIQLIGFSFGGVLAMEMMYILEQEGYRGKLVVIDSSPDLFKGISQGIFEDGEEAFQITYIMYFLMNWKLVQPNESLTIIEEIKAQSTWEGKLDWFVNKLSPQFDVSPTHFKGINDAVLNRFKSILTYNWNHEKQLISRVMLLQPTMKIINIADDYGLPKYCKNLEAVHVIEGSHLSILSHPDTANYINDFFESSSKE